MRVYIRDHIRLFLIVCMLLLCLSRPLSLRTFLWRLFCVCFVLFCFSLVLSVSIPFCDRYGICEWFLRNLLVFFFFFTKCRERKKKRPFRCCCSEVCVCHCVCCECEGELCLLCFLRWGEGKELQALFFFTLFVLSSFFPPQHHMLSFNFGLIIMMLVCGVFFLLTPKTGARFG